jgi:hypothetical protein
LTVGPSWTSRPIGSLNQANLNTVLKSVCMSEDVPVLLLEQFRNVTAVHNRHTAIITNSEAPRIAQANFLGQPWGRLQAWPRSHEFS